MQLSDWIRQYRTSHGLSMQAFADLCGFSKAYIGQLEKGINPKTRKKISPTMQTFSKIANGTGLSVDELLSILDDNQPISIGHQPSQPESPSDQAVNEIFDDENLRALARDRLEGATPVEIANNKRRLKKMIEVMFDAEGEK